jgi:hypothetical protein
MTNENRKHNDCSGLPPCAAEYIARVVRKVRYRKRVRRDIAAELTAHFEDELRTCTTDAERDAKARQVIEGFGDPKLLAVLCRRAKKRCRPLWAKVLVRSSQAVGIVILYTVVCMLPLVFGRPVVKVNYIEWLNDRWKPQDAGAENARQYYDQAVKLYVEPPEPVKKAMNAWGAALEHWDEAGRQALGAWLTQNQAAFDAFRKGGNTEHYWPVYVSRPPVGRGFAGMMQMATDATASTNYLGKYRTVAVALRQQIAFEADEKRMAEAFDDCLVLQRAGRHLQGKNFLVEQLVGIAVEQIGYGEILTLLQRPGVTPAALARLQTRLWAAFDQKRRVIDLESEKSVSYNNIQYTFTDDGHGGGHALAPGLIFGAGSWGGNVARLFVFHYPSRREATAMIDRYFEQAQAALSVLPSRSEAEGVWQAVERTTSENVFLQLMGPIHPVLATREWQPKTYEAATIAAVAIFRYKLDKGQYPARFEDLVSAGYLAALPADPFGKGPLSYKRTDDGFLLYSWGPNLSDEGGWPSTDKDGKPRMWTENNDWVFWPVTSSN